MSGHFVPFEARNKSPEQPQRQNAVEYPRSIRELAIEDAIERGAVYSDPELEATHEAHIESIEVIGQYIERMRAHELGPDIKATDYELAA